MNRLSCPRTLVAAAVLAAPLSVATARPTPVRVDARPDRQEAKPLRMAPQKYSSTSEARRYGEDPLTQGHSAARIWNEELLFAIRRDYARPTVHARNLYHISAAMWDAWAAFDDVADQVFHQERMASADVAADRTEAISYAAYRIMAHRFANSPGAVATMAEIDATFASQGYDKTYTATDESTPASLGNRIAASVIAFGFTDNANEQGGYDNLVYQPVNQPLILKLPGSQDIADPNRWQPLAFDLFIDQGGHIIPDDVPAFLSPEWGIVTPFALHPDDANVYQRDGFDWWVFHDPGDPPYLGGAGDDYYKWGNEMVVVWSAHLDATDGVMIDISPASFGNTPIPDNDDWASYYNFMDGGDSGMGHALNPSTGLPYAPQVVPRGDYARILAEFWADGPDSETPPGHWFTIWNYVSDHPAIEKRFSGQGPILDDLEWDVKTYLVLGGAMHDAAITAWGCKGWYDYIRPISAIRYMCDLGQCSDSGRDNFHVDGINLLPGYIEVVTSETTAPGQRHEHLAGEEGKIAVKSWRGHDFIQDPDVDVAGVGWILAEDWWPYQRPTFVTPPFAGYVSGHSTYSRAAAEAVTLITADEFFPGGMGEFFCEQNEFLVFEDGPSQDITLQWATYRDASDQTSLSRIWGGIHPPADDLPGRQMGLIVGPDAFHHARRYFTGQVSCPADFSGDGQLTVSDVLAFLDAYQSGDPLADFSSPRRELNFFDVSDFIRAFIAGCD